ncbi:hypothetical protein BpHYR1_000114 [Brachionus plicatilis]|uniref:Uncharacterized protein n=1 Tax=Brachionus plicatilis TaxID=10195 RepID=A0A3M7QLD0_BRAPC|nr:hypothetical protein BpHYR1_000114 [Brachionus plicatilis]
MHYQSLAFCFDWANFIISLVYFLFHDVGFIPVVCELPALTPFNDIVPDPHQVAGFEFSGVNVFVVV